MLDIIKNNIVVKGLGLFLVFYLSLVILFSFSGMKSVHNSFFVKAINPMHNFINPDVHCRFASEHSTQRQHFGISVALFDKGKFGNRWKDVDLIRTKPDVIKYPNLHSLVLLPTLLIFALFLATPISLVKRVLCAISGIMLFYLVLTFYFAYVFEMTLNRGQFEVDSIWLALVSIFGVDNAEGINVFAIMIWLLIAVPALYRRYGKEGFAKVLTVRRLATSI